MNIPHIEKLQYEMFKLKNDIIFTKSFWHFFAEELISVEPDFFPEGAPSRKVAEECFAPHKENAKETRNTHPNTARQPSKEKQQSFEANEHLKPHVL